MRRTLTDEKGTFVDGNKAAERLSGYERNELKGKNLLSLHLLPDSDLESAAQNLARSAQGQSVGPDLAGGIRLGGCPGNGGVDHPGCGCAQRQSGGGEKHPSLERKTSDFRPQLQVLPQLGWNGGARRNSFG